jgi:hypothetical protein
MLIFRVSEQYFVSLDNIACHWPIQAMTRSEALAFAATAVLANQLPSDLTVRVRASLRRALRRSFSTNYTGGNPETIWWIGRKYGYWGDQKLKAAALQSELDALAADSPASWKIWRLLGLDVPDRALLEVANAEGISRGAEGWIAEVLHGKPARVIRRLKGLAVDSGGSRVHCRPRVVLTFPFRTG